MPVWPWSSRSDMRALLVGLAALPLAPAACVPQGDFAGTAYRCEEDPICPDGFTCVDGTCVAPGAGGDDGGDDEAGIPTGTFEMGCDPGAGDCPADAQPARPVELAAFSIDSTEVTEEAYAACVADGACAAPGDFEPAARPRAPVRGVSWQEAADYCAWRGARLPTEAVWERAARGSDDRRYPWGDDAPRCELAALAGCAGGAPVDVQSLEGDGPFGTADLLGNVAEWVADFYQADYYAHAPDRNPSGPDSGGERVVRGGSYLDDPPSIAAWTRGHDDALHREPTIGFRCAE